ncbi:DUF2470 domain-containing protein [Microbacterium sp. CFBP9034]|uniref:DUF2470 domain-containing protein n=1 Tax=Microbacterium sp. CFBP9034 TaxID=3096540 RepID=UPI002A6AA8EC|nr:DUF2470 domain-containing protein [Microbacterium sp. CFBP9034]MDY0908176.1 DUF2470 domain-containing protein [Microbacterium sp. CFBP9034]
MTHFFDDATRGHVLGHMNGDHGGDNLLIVRAFSSPADVDGIIGAVMTHFDGDAGTWLAERADGTEREIRVPWPGGPIDSRPEVRREIVALYDEACRRLGVEPRPHS